MRTETPSEIRVKDPLSDVTRKERRFLLALSMLGIILIKAGMIPTKLTTLGLEFCEADQNTLLVIMGFVNLYVLAAFIIYASSDFLAWRLAFNKLSREVMKQKHDEKRKATYIDDTMDGIDAHFEKKTSLMIMMTRPISVIRALFEFVLPVVVGIYSTVLMWSAKLPQASN